MLKTLTIYSRDRIDKLAEIIWVDGTAIVHGENHPEMVDELWDIINHGLNDWVIHEEYGDIEPRHTPSSDPVFMSRLKDYLNVQFGFVLEES